MLHGENNSLNPFIRALRSKVSPRLLLGSFVGLLIAASSCSTPPEEEVLNGLPCDSNGQCATGYTCLQQRCVFGHLVSTGDTGGASSSTGGAAQGGSTG